MSGRTFVQVVCCYIPGMLRVETENALRVPPDRVYVRWEPLDPEDDTAYGRKLAEAWRDCLLAGAGLAVVEQDIVVGPDVLTAFRDNPHEYVAFPYAWKTDVGPALGCTRFSHRFVAKYPHLMEEAVATGVGWRQFDVTLMRHLLARKYGEQPHVLLPPVEHLNEEKRLLPDASPEPLMTLPHW